MIIALCGGRDMVHETKNNKATWAWTIRNAQDVLCCCALCVRVSWG
jgi:hypothetical protein